VNALRARLARLERARRATGDDGDTCTIPVRCVDLVTCGPLERPERTAPTTPPRVDYRWGLAAIAPLDWDGGEDASTVSLTLA
jgi:hypothetical protein